MTRQPGSRVAVVGTTGSGKTTTAQAISRALDLPHVELDSLYWQAGWVPSNKDDFRQKVAQVLSGARWVTDGNYSAARSVIWARATTLVWLDYPLPVILWQLARRTLSRIIRREVLWNNNQETWRGAFFSKESLFLYAISSQPRHRREYPVEFLRPEYAHLQVIHHKSRRETQQWLASLNPAAARED